MQAGKLRHRLTFQRNSNAAGAARNAFSEPIQEWADAFTVPGAREDLGSREFPGYKKHYEESTVRFRIRYRPDVATAGSSELRVVYTETHLPGPILANIQKPTAKQRIFDLYPAYRGEDGRPTELILEAREIH